MRWEPVFFSFFQWSRLGGQSASYTRVFNVKRKNLNISYTQMPKTDHFT